MLRAGQDRFVLKYERNREQQFKLLIQSGQQKLAGSTSVTPQRRSSDFALIFAAVCAATAFVSGK